jgi:hypothetical protein
MSLRSARLLSLTICLFAFATLVSVNLSGQQPKVLAPHKHAPQKLPDSTVWHMQASRRSMVGGLWMIDANFRSSLQLANKLKISPLTVTPVLYMSNGAKYVLPDVKLEAAATYVLDINEALRQKGIAPWATLSGYVEVEYMWPWNALCATIEDIDATHSLIFTYGLRSSTANGPPSDQSETVAPQAQVLEGMWWKQESNVTGFVSLSNTLAEQVKAKLEITDDRGENLAVHNVTVSPHGTKLIALSELHSVQNRLGGLRITYVGPKNGLLTYGGLKDDNTGYSAPLSMRSVAASTQRRSETYAALGLMTGAADPMMSFPVGTTFTPYAVVRNISNENITVTPTLWWMKGGAALSAPLPQLTLLPYETQNLGLSFLLSQIGLNEYNGSFNLQLNSQGQSGALLAATGSVDEKNTYVFAVAPEGIAESQAKSISYWSTSNGDDTMVAVWNPSDEDQDFIFTLYFVGGHYGYPIHLGPRATRTFNVSEIVQNPTPDAEGNLVPTLMRQGSLEISGAEGEAQHILVAFSAATYNVQKATCGGDHCRECTGPIGDELIDYGFNLPMSGTKQQNFYLRYTGGSTYDVTTRSTWTSSASDIASVTVNGGLVSGVSNGTLDLTADYGDDTFPWDDCTTGETYPPCETRLFEGSSPGTVSPTVTFSGTPVIPQGKTATITATVSPSSNTTSITLTLATASGSGSALFLNGSTTMTITTTTALTLIGTQSSSTPNNISLTATITAESQKMTVGSTTLTVATTGGAVPVNFLQTGVSTLSGTVLQFTYTWGSSSGSLADISTCTVREFVTYPGYVQGQQLNYAWTSPPYVNTTSPNPTTGVPGSASGAGLTDQQGNVGFVKPYVANTVTSNQVYQFQCPYYQNNAWVQFFPASGTISITRVVQQVGATWQYSISKSGSTATGILP